MRYLLAFLAAYPVACFPVAAQCPVSVDAGPDRVVCSPGASASLQGTIDGPSLGFEWSPSAGLSNPLSLSPTVSVSGTQSYSLTAFAFDPNAPNLLVNGDFESGNTAFTSGYSFNPTPITPGTYTLTTSPALVLSTFPPCDDHTFGNGTGFMMLVNGAGVPGTNVWCQSVPVTPNAWYHLSAWVAASPISPPQLQFQVNGVPVGNAYQATGSGCLWQEFSASWNAATATSATVCIVSLNAGNGLFGDDYSLDDVSMTAACTASDVVTVSLASVEAVLPFTAFLACNAAQTGIQLDGSASSSGPDVSYEWSGPGILSGGNSPVATVNEPGTYSLTVTTGSGASACSDVASVEVLPDPNIAVAAAFAPPPLSCLQPIGTIDGAGTSTGPSFSYDWSFSPGPGGIPPGILSGGNTPSPVVDQPGTYTLVVTNAVSGCTATTSVLVSADLSPPLAAADNAGPLSCTMPSATLDGTGSSTGPAFSYLWSTSDGFIASGANTLQQCVVSAPGLYTLTVTNSQNGCSASASTLVSGTAALPTADAGPPAVLSCADSIAFLNGTGSGPGDSLAFHWTHFSPVGVPGNGIASGDSTLMPTVFLPGWYVLTVTDLDSGCTASDSVLVTSDVVPPLASAGPPRMLSCQVPSLPLDGSGSSTGPTLVYLWSFVPAPGSVGPGFVSGSDSLFPVVNAAGTYFLSVLDTANGCSAADSTLVSTDGGVPVVQILSPDSLDCLTDSVLLSAQVSSAGAPLSFSWAFFPAPGTMGNGIAAGDTTLHPLVTLPGTYTLTATDPANGCTSAASVDIVLDTVPPLADAGPNRVLTCTDTVALLSGSLSSQGPPASFSYAWTALSGTLFSGPDSLSAQTAAPGTFVLTVSRTSNGCTASDTAVVSTDTFLPELSVGPTDTLTCTDTVLQLAAQLLPAQGSASFAWSFLPDSPPDTGWVADLTSLSPWVHAPGWYVLTVIDSANGCVDSDSVRVIRDVALPDWSLLPPDTLTCLVTGTQLSVTGIPVAGTFSYLWSSADGQLASADSLPTVVAVLPGTYVLSLSNLQNGCAASDSVQVAADDNPPVVSVAPVPALSCLSPVVQLSAAVSPATDSLYFEWSSNDGHFVGGPLTPTPAVDAPGTYVLTVTDLSNGCTAVDSIVVFQDASLPIAVAVPDATLSCTQPVATLDGSGSDVGPDILYAWTSPDGNFLSGQFSLTPVVDAPGTYVLTVTNVDNNCQASASVVVSDDTVPPALFLAAPDPLTCSQPVVWLSGDLPSGMADIVAAWTFPDGSVQPADASLSLPVGTPGAYTLSAVDTVSGCSSAVLVSLPIDTSAPLVLIDGPAILSCLLPAVPLVAVASAPAGHGLDFLWQTTDGILLSDPTSLAAIAGAAGTYQLLVTDSFNGCTAASAVSVSADVAPPLALAGPAPSFGCDPTAILTLDGSASSQGPSFGYAWSFLPGSGGTGPGLVGAADVLQPQVNAPGWYVLTVTDSSNGCAAVDSVLVLPPAVPPSLTLLPPAVLTCAAPLVFLQAEVAPPGTDYVYAWSTTDGQFATAQDLPSPGVLSAGSYTLTLSDAAGSCEVSASVLVSEDKSEPGASAAADTLTCLETAVALSGSSPTLNVTFQWSTVAGNILFGQQSAAPGVDAPGDYTLTVTNPANGCTSTASVTVVRLQLDSFGFQVIPAGCIDGTGSLAFGPVTGGAPPFRYSVDGGLSFQLENVFQDLPPGSYALVVKDDDNCRLDGVALVPEPPTLSLSLPESVALELGAAWIPNPVLNVPPANLVQIAWDPADWVDCPDCLQPSVSASQDGLLSLSVTDANGCRAAAVTRLSVRQVLDAFVPNVFSPNGDGINDRLAFFANPGQMDRILEWKIFSRWGELVFDGKDLAPNDAAAGWDGTHRGQILDAGLFGWSATVRLTNGKLERLKGEVTLLR